MSFRPEASALRRRITLYDYSGPAKGLQILLRFAEFHSGSFLLNGVRLASELRGYLGRRVIREKLFQEVDVGPGPQSLRRFLLRHSCFLSTNGTCRNLPPQDGSDAAQTKTI